MVLRPSVFNEFTLPTATNWQTAACMENTSVPRAIFSWGTEREPLLTFGESPSPGKTEYCIDIYCNFTSVFSMQLCSKGKKKKIISRLHRLHVFK